MNKRNLAVGLAALVNMAGVNAQVMDTISSYNPTISEMEDRLEQKYPDSYKVWAKNEDLYEIEDLNRAWREAPALGPRPKEDFVPSYVSAAIKADTRKNWRIIAAAHTPAYQICTVRNNSVRKYY